MTRPPPSMYVQAAAAAARGKATVAAPTWSGTISVAIPMVRGSRKRKVPAMER